MGKFKSRKFWFALVGATLPVASQAFTEQIELGEALQLSTAIIMSYIFGQGYVDAKKG